MRLCFEWAVTHSRTQVQHPATWRSQPCLTARPLWLQTPARRWLAQLLINVGFPEAAAALASDIVAPTPLTTS